MIESKKVIIQENSLKEKFGIDLENLSDDDLYQEAVKAIQITKDTKGDNIWRDNAVSEESKRRNKPEIYFKAARKVWA